MSKKRQKKQVSPQKLAANRSNAQRSTGPQTEAGKAKAAQNSFKHGFFALRLFPSTEQRAQDGEDFTMVYNGLYRHYAPSGFMEHFWLEKIASEALRLARVLGYGQKVLGWQAPFEERSIDRLLRYEGTINRNFAQAVKNLELLQAERNAELDELAPTDSEPDPLTEELEQIANEPSLAPEHPVNEKPTSASTLEVAPEARPTAEDDTADATDKTEPTPADAEAPHQTPETHQSPTPPETYETNPPFSSRWVETAEDQELIEKLYKELYGDL
jgi:hypothetical protein